MAYILKWKLGELKLTSGTYVIGRSPMAHVHIDDQSVSRRHAEICAGASGLQVRDLGSSNGVRINGRRVTEQVLQVGDRIHVGRYELEVAEDVTLDKAAIHVRQGAARAKVERHVPAASILRSVGESMTDELEGQYTQRADPLEMMSAEAESALCNGRAEIAERMLSWHLRGGLKRVQLGEAPTIQRCSMLAGLALRLAVAQRKPEWVEYVFELYTSAKAECPSSVLAEVESAVRQVPGVSKSAIRMYANALRSLRDSSSTRALLSSIEALERAV